jgi:hypothetical protein|tara:strand:+ start:735 stop:908 length:174 start_codon:yes stop_codon:yes gene_type:complete
MAIRNYGDFIRYHNLIFGQSDTTEPAKKKGTQDTVDVGIIFSPRKPEQKPQQIEEKE